jgi:hypothetical protein
MPTPRLRPRPHVFLCLALAVTVLLAGCGSTTKYVLPSAPPSTAAAPSPGGAPSLEGAPSGEAAPPASAPSGEACVASCKRGNTFALRKKDRVPIWDHDCLQKCPGIVVSEGECEEGEKEPHGFCVEKHEKGAAAELVGGVIALTVLIVTVAAVASK